MSPWIDDQVEQRVPDPLIGNVHERLPLALALVMAELDGRGFGVAELYREFELAQLVAIQTDRILPVAEVIDPVIPIVNLTHHGVTLTCRGKWVLVCPGRPAGPPQYRRSGIIAFGVAIRRPAIAARFWASLEYSARLANDSARGGLAASMPGQLPGFLGQPSWGTTRLNSPIRNASWASITSAVNTSSSALAMPDQPGQEIGAAPVRVQADPIERLSDGSPVRRDPEVAGQRQIGPASGGRPVHRGDDRLRRLANGGHHVPPGFDQRLGGAPILLRQQPFHVTDVGTGTERPAGTSDDQYPNGRIGGRLSNGIGQLLSHTRRRRR